MLSIVDKIKPEDWVVLELSSWQLEDMDRQKISPHIAVVTNVLQDHLNRYTGMRPYARAKESIVLYQKKGDVAVLNKENAWTRAMAKKTKAKVYFSSNRRGRTSTVQRSDLNILGEHNIQNAQAAATVARAIGISAKTIIGALKKFRGLPDRLEYIRTVHGVRYYNDTTATTPDATVAALKTLSHQEPRIILIAGGSDKKLDYKSLMPWIKKTCKAVVFLPGAATDKIKKLAVSCQLSVVADAASMPSAVRTASRLATRGDIVLLSPAAASFARPPKSASGRRRRGLFQHEFDRGEQFRRAVKSLIPNP
ncbi:MAG: UDP-N-acetylmuramoyl-L-alanine--D-glutamate ligase [bacterium]|nr:UDP-N-acetylmuramoyl-L-alanine--D-glutamate ligase [bacterium]